MVPNIHVSVIKAPLTASASRLRAGGLFHDLVPWADPYIAALVNKVERSAAYAYEQGSRDDESALDAPPEGHDWS